MSEPLLPRIWSRRLLALVLIILVVAMVAALQSVIMPFLLAWIAAYIVSPVVDMLEKRWRGRREAAVLFVMSVVALIGLLALVVTIPIVINESTTLVRAIPRYREAVMVEVDYWQTSGRIPAEARFLAQDVLVRLEAVTPQIATTVGALLFSWIGSLLGIFGFLLDFLMFIFVFYYFLLDFHQINQRLMAAAPSRHHARMYALFAQIDLNLRTVMRGQLIVALCMGALYTVSLAIAGVPYAILIGPISGLGNFLPYVGPMLGMIPAFLFTILHAGGDMHTMMVQGGWILAIFGIVQVLESYVLTPKLAGGSVGLGPVAVLFALSVGGELLGIVGVVAALPLATVVKVLLSEGWAAYQASDFFNGGNAAA